MKIRYVTFQCVDMNGIDQLFCFSTIKAGVRALAVLDIIITLIKILLIAGLSYFSESHLQGVLIYSALVAVPLLLMRWSVGFPGSKIGLLCLSLVGLELLFYQDRSNPELVA